MLVHYACLYLLAKIDSTSCQFKEHIDLQKIDEIMFHNEKYNVLKPTIHIIKDHFVEFIQKRHNTDTSERMFLDRNGLQHIWKGLEIPKLRSFRKADIPQKAIDDGNQTTKNDPSAIVKRNTTKTVESTVTFIKKGNPRQTKTTTESPKPTKPNLREGDTLIKTTFFCPFFGVVRMSTQVHNFDETGNKR